MLPIESVMLGEGAFGIGQMTHITKHATADGPSGTYRQVGQAAVEIAESQPRFRWQLQSATQEISNHIGMTDNNFKFVGFGWFGTALAVNGRRRIRMMVVVIRIRIIRSIEILSKRSFHLCMSFVNFLNCGW